MRLITSLLLATIAGTLIPATAAFPGALSDDDEPGGGGRFKLRPVLRLNLDTVTVGGDDSESKTQGVVRRLRVGVAGRLGDRLRFRIEREVSGDGGWRNAYIALRPNPEWEVRLGNMIAPVSLEDLQGASDQSLAERSLANALAPGFATGLQVSHSARRHSITAGFFGPGLRDDDSRATSEGYGVAGRVTGLLVDGKRWKVHAGGGFERRSNSDNGRARVSARASGPYGPVVVRTPVLEDLKTRSTLSLEGAVLHRSLAIQAQYMISDLQRRSGQDVRFSGGYLQASWMVNGSGYRYDRRRGMPRAADRDKGRAYELLGRISEVELDSPNLAGGQATSAEVGGALHLNDHLSVTSTAGVTRYKTDHTGPKETSAFWVTRLSARF